VIHRRAGLAVPDKNDITKARRGRAVATMRVRVRTGSTSWSTMLGICAPVLSTPPVDDNASTGARRPPARRLPLASRPAFALMRQQGHARLIFTSFVERACRQLGQADYGAGQDGLSRSAPGTGDRGQAKASWRERDSLPWRPRDRGGTLKLGGRLRPSASLPGGRYPRLGDDLHHERPEVSLGRRGPVTASWIGVTDGNLHRDLTARMALCNCDALMFERQTVVPRTARRSLGRPEEQWRQ